MKRLIYVLITLFYLFLVIAGLVEGISWFSMIFIIYGLVYFGSKFMDCLD